MGLVEVHKNWSGHDVNNKKKDDTVEMQSHASENWMFFPISHDYEPSSFFYAHYTDTTYWFSLSLGLSIII